VSALWRLSPRVVFLLVVLLFLGLANSLQARQVQPHQGPPPTVLHFESITDISTGLSAAGTTADQPVATDQSFAISFQAFGKQFNLQLVPNDLFAPQAENIWIGDQTTTTETPRPIFYRGEVTGESGSWVRIGWREGAMDGLIRTKDDMYFVEPGARFFNDASSHATVIYRMSDTVSDWELGSCALEQPAVAFEMGQHARASSPLGDYEGLVSDLQTLASSSALKQLDLGIVADYGYFVKHGAASAADMQNIINQIDGIYQSAVGVTLRVSKTVVYTTPDPFSGTTDPATLLDEFSTYKGNSASPVYGTDLAHLFTNRNFNGNLVGIAWLGTVCNSSYGTGLSKDFTTDNKSRVLLTAHEIGHNFDAPHDNQAGSACASTPFGFIMNPYVSTALNLQFSSCSIGIMTPEVAGASCLATVPAPSSLVSAIAPVSRSVQVGNTATAYALALNYGKATALGCGISPVTSLPATFFFQATNCATNLPVGSPNTPVDIPANGAGCFIFALTPSSSIAPTNVTFNFDCTNSDPAPITPGVNTLLFSASSTPTPDLLAMAATTTGGGIVDIPGPTGQNFIALATVNVGAGGTITAEANTGSVTLPVTLTICQTNPTTGACINPQTPGPSATLTIGAGGVATLTVIVQGSGTIPFDPAINRIVINFHEGSTINGTVRGRTSVAVRTH
jgi:Metallo-peptidase family M12